MKDKFLMIFSVFLILAFALTSCGQITAPASDGAKSDGSVEVTLWHSYQTGSAEESTINALVAKAMEENPTWKIDVLHIPFDQIFNKYQTEVAAGAGPDMFVAPNDDLGTWARGGLVAPLDDLLVGKLGNVSQVAIDGMKVDGVLYGVPESAKAVALYYNKDLVTTPPKTTDELMDMVKDGTQLSLFLGAYHMFGFTGSFGGKLMDDTGKCIADQGGWAEATQYILDLKEAGAIVESDYGKAETPFREGTAAMFVNGPWALADYKADLGDSLGVIMIPEGTAKASPLNGIDGFYINPNSTNIDGVVEVALYLTNKESSQYYTDNAGHVPVRSDVVSADPLVAAFAEASASGFPRPQSAEFANFWTPFGDAWTKVVEGASTPEEAVAEACASMNSANEK
jgi:arabinogalactan oligomer/maltooligosaccharide transport system substrate-binding protein